MSPRSIASTTRAADRGTQRLRVGSTEREVWLATHYFVPSQAAIPARRRGDARPRRAPAAAGTKRFVACGRIVALVFPSAATNRRADLPVWPAQLHAKTLLADDGFAVIGSAKFDSRSFRLNFELSVLFHDQGVAADLDHILTIDHAVAHAVAVPASKPSFPQRLGEGFARLFSPIP